MVAEFHYFIKILSTPYNMFSSHCCFLWWDLWCFSWVVHHGLYLQHFYDPFIAKFEDSLFWHLFFKELQAIIAWSMWHVIIQAPPPTSITSKIYLVYYCGNYFQHKLSQRGSEIHLHAIMGSIVQLAHYNISNLMCCNHWLSNLQFTTNSTRVL